MRRLSEGGQFPQIFRRISRESAETVRLREFSSPEVRMKCTVITPCNSLFFLLTWDFGLVMGHRSLLKWFVSYSLILISEVENKLTCILSLDLVFQGGFLMERSLENMWQFCRGAVMQKLILVRLIWKFVEVTLCGSSGRSAAFLLNNFLRGAPGRLLLYHLLKTLFHQ